MVNKYSMTLIIKDEKGEVVTLIDQYDCELKVVETGTKKESILSIETRCPRKNLQNFVPED